jgi:uncharacterized protein YjeT (DUF2065 family)
MMSLVLIIGGMAAVNNPRYFSMPSGGRITSIVEMSKVQSRVYGYLSIAAGTLCLTGAAFWKRRL